MQQHEVKLNEKRSKIPMFQHCVDDAEKDEEDEKEVKRNNPNLFIHLFSYH